MRDKASVEHLSTSFSGAGGLTIRFVPNTPRNGLGDQVREAGTCCNLVSTSAATGTGNVASAHQ